MDRPPGGWSDLVTRDYLDAKLSAVDARFDAIGARFDAIDTQFDALRSDFRAETANLSGAVDRRLRAQTWITTGTLITGLGLAFGAAQFA